MSETPKPEQKTASILRAASVIMTGLPELPGYNGAVLIIDDDEASRISMEISEASEAFELLERELAEAKEREEKLKTMLLDPATVHINMLRGTIAKLDWPTLEHIHGNHPLRAQRDALLEALEELRDAPWLNLPGRAGEIVEAAIALAKGGGQ